MATSDITTTDNDNIVPKHEPFEDALTPDSESLSPEPEGAAAPTEEGSTSREPAPVPKRKGGRKPVRSALEFPPTAADPGTDLRHIGGEEAT